MINGVLVKLAKWFAVNKLTMKLSKTNYVIFNLFINNQQITRIYVKKILGVYIDESLNWKYQINKVRLKLSKVAAVIYKANFLIDQNGVIAVKCREKITLKTFMALLYYRNE